MRALVLLLLVACQSGHEVRILLGPNEDTLSAGFLCVDENNVELIRKTLIPGNPPTFQFAVVVDIIGVGDRVPGCRGEELVTACEGGGCRILVRACRVVSIEAGGLGAENILAQLRAKLEGFTVIDDAPNEPVLIRVVTVDLPSPLSLETTECPAAAANPATNLMDAAVGCAYSCPVQLDDVDEISVSLDALTRQCEGAVTICAGFLR